MNTPITKAYALATAIALAACTHTPQEASAALPPFKPAASIQNLMASIVDPPADGLWESVSTETSIKGIEERQPRTDPEWLAVRHNAIVLQGISIGTQDGRDELPLLEKGS